MSAPVSPLRDKAADGHQLLVVLNESRLLDTKVDGKWESRHLGSRGSLAKGIYDLTGAEKPLRNVAGKTYDGNVLHVTPQHVYQTYTADNGKSALVKHDRALLQQPGRDLPPVGARLAVAYERGQARLVTGEREHGR